MLELEYIPEPLLRFRHDQHVEDPRDGLSLFGPLDELKPAGVRCAVIGTNQGMYRFQNWHQTLSRPVCGQIVLQTPIRCNVHLPPAQGVLWVGQSLQDREV